jgi:hypothetical protein
MLLFIAGIMINPIINFSLNFFLSNSIFAHDESHFEALKNTTGKVNSEKVNND